MGQAGRLGAGKRRMTCPHAGIVSGGAKAEADLGKGTGQQRARQAHGQLSTGGAGRRGAAGCWRAAVLAVQGLDQTGQRKNIPLALDTVRISGQTLLQAVAREQAGGLGVVGPTGRLTCHRKLGPKSRSISSGMHVTK
jgi:hypothetical protein